MIETVQERQRGAYDFASYYDNLCALQDACPVPAVKAHLTEGILDINCDRIRLSDWEPVLNSIRINKNLRFIALRSYFQLDLGNGPPEKRPAILRARIPAVRAQQMTAALCQSLRSCLKSTEQLCCLELQGIPLREQDVMCLIKGLSKNTTLSHLSLEYCHIGDVGLQIVCAGLKHAGRVTTLNLTGCSLTSSGMQALTSLIQYQAMCRHNEAWRQSLRYRRPNLDSMPGLRRITLNQNPLIENGGALLLAEALKDDLWVKAIDLQRCSLGNEASRAFLGVLKYNSTLVVLDLRQNPLIDRDLLRAVTEQVLINGDGKQTEFKWLKANAAAGTSRPDLDQRHSRVPYTGPSKPLQESKRPIFKPAGGQVRSRSAGPAVRHSAVTMCEDAVGETPVSTRSSLISARSSRRGGEMGKLGPTGQQHSGLPWRTAARATRYKGYPPDHVPGKTHMEENFEELDDTQQPPAIAMRPREHPHQRDDGPIRDEQEGEVDLSVVTPLVTEFEGNPAIPADIKGLKMEVLNLRRQLKQENEAKQAAERSVNQLHREMERLSRKMAAANHATHQQRGDRSAILASETVLESIETSFQQFHAFLDLLRDAGLGRVVTAAGMDQFGASIHPLLNSTPATANGTRLSPHHHHQHPRAISLVHASGDDDVLGGSQNSADLRRRPRGVASNGVGDLAPPRPAQRSRHMQEFGIHHPPVDSRMTIEGEAVNVATDLPAAGEGIVPPATADPVGTHWTGGGHGLDTIGSTARVMSETDRLFARIKGATEDGTGPTGPGHVRTAQMSGDSGMRLASERNDLPGYYAAASKVTTSDDSSEASDVEAAVHETPPPAVEFSVTANRGRLQVDRPPTTGASGGVLLSGAGMATFGTSPAPGGNASAVPVNGYGTSMRHERDTTPHMSPIPGQRSGPATSATASSKASHYSDTFHSDDEENWDGAGSVPPATSAPYIGVTGAGPPGDADEVAVEVEEEEDFSISLTSGSTRPAI